MVSRAPLKAWPLFQLMHTRPCFRDRADMKKCWGYLDLTSRSFAAVIKELEGDLSRVVSRSRRRRLNSLSETES